MAPVDVAAREFVCEGCGARFPYRGEADAVHQSCPGALTADGDRHHDVPEADREAVLEAIAAEGNQGNAAETHPADAGAGNGDGNGEAAS